MQWKAIPKPSMSDNMYWEGYWSKYKNFSDMDAKKQEVLLKDYKYILNEVEPAFDAADITRCGKDIFIQQSMTTNLAAINWLSKELKSHVRVHKVNFPYDKEP